MKDFIYIARDDMRSQREGYINLGYSVPYNSYKMISNIKLLENNLDYEIRINNKEVFFYILNQNTYHYMTIVDIYNVIQNVVLEYPHHEKAILECLDEKHLQTKKFEYNSKIYCYESTHMDIPDLNVILEKKLEIKLKDIIELLYLIQGKSNALFANEKEYQYGIIRLISMMIKLDGDSDVLNIRGWKYNDDRFVLDKNIANERYKYYLTKTEYLV